MKRRLLSLLLVMAMLLSMVPFQAFAKEADEAPALLEETEEIVSEPTEETIADPTEDTVPDTTEETVPDTTEETVPETTEEIIPETTEETVPETTEETVPETTEEIIPEIMEEIVPETTEAKDPLPLMILEGMDGGYDEDGHMPAKSIRANQTFQLQARLTVGSEINEGLTWHLDGNSKYGDCQPIIVQPDGTVTFNTAFDFDETGTSASGAWAIVVARQVVKEGEEKTVADSPAVISMFPELKMRMVIGNPENVEDSQPIDGSFTINIADGAEPFDIGAYPCDYGPFGGSTLKITDKRKVVSAVKNIKHVEGYFDNEYYTITPKKTGTFTITATAKDNPDVTVSATINVVKVPKTIGIKVPASARFFEVGDEKTVIMTAGQKLSLSTDLPKDTTGKVTWDIVGGEYITGEICSLDTVAPEGASADGEDWSAIATIDRNKGVLTTYAGVTAENCVITVRATLTPSVDGVGTITADLPVLIQPPVESFYIDLFPVSALTTSDEPDEPSVVPNEGGVNRKYPYPADYDIGNGPFVLFTDYSQPFVPYNEVKWNIGKNATVQPLEEYIADHSDVTYVKDEIEWFMANNAVVVTPKAPGKLNISAACTDGGGAKVSAVVNVYGNTRVIDITAPEPMKAGDKPVTLTVKAYYDDDATLQIAKPKLNWDVVELCKIYNIDATDDDGNCIYKDENGDIYPWVYFDGTDYYERDYNDAATVKNGKLTLGRITKNTKLLVSAYGEEYPIAWNASDEPFEWDCASDDVVIDVTVPEGSESLVIALAYRDEGSEEIVPDWAFTETWDMTGAGYYVVPALMDADGNLELAEDAKLTVKGSAKKDAEDPYLLHFYKDGKATITATLGKQKATATVHVRMPATFVEINNPATDGKLNSPVTAGKSVKLTATSKHSWDSNDEPPVRQVAKASVQKFEWYLLKEDAVVNDDNWYNCITVENDAAKINTKTGVLTAKNVEEKTWVRAMVIDSERNRAAVTVTILPKDKTYVTAYGLAVPETYSVNTMSPYIPLGKIGVTALRGGEQVPFTITDISVSPAKLATISDAHLEPEETIKCIVLTGKTGKATISVTGTIAGQTKPVTVKATVNLVNAVTDIQITRPTNKDGSFVPAYVGKSLKLTAKVNKDATNKKLNWGVCYYNGDPEGEFDWELDGDKLEELYWNDNTTVKNGVLKIDKSWYSHGRCYAVWAESQDGYWESDPIFIQAYAMTGAINIDCYGNWPDGNYADYLNNRTVTIKQGEELEFRALVYDVNGDYGANPDVTWTISGKKNIVEKLYEEIYEGEGEGDVDVLGLKGLNPGTVTIKATAKDGSRKTATFKLVVSNETYKK